MKDSMIFIRTKRNIILMCIGIVMGMLLVFSVITEVIYKNNIFQTVDQQLYTHKNMILNDIRVKEKEGEIEEVILPAPLVKDLISYVWQDDRLLNESPHAYEGSSLYPIFLDDAQEGKIYSIEDMGNNYRGMMFEAKGCKVQILVNVNMQIASLNSLRSALLRGLILLVAISLVLAFYLANMALRPLYKAYDKMAAFVQNASHEMRTPLAVMKGKLELFIRQGEDRIEEHYEELGMMMSELTGLEKLNKDLLILSKEDLGTTLQLTELTLKEFIDEIAELYEELARLKDIQFQVGLVDNKCTVIWDRIKVRQCITILLDNALKYTQPGGKIRLEVKTTQRVVEVAVQDTGCGIREEEIPYIFDRFYRSNEMRGKQIEGNGIGLSLLQAFAKSMHIKVSVNSNYKVGSTFFLEIPKKL